MIKPPLAITLHLAEALEFHPTEYKASLKGIINDLTLSRHGNGKQPLCVYLLLTDGAGEGELRLEVFEVREAKEPKEIYRYGRWEKFVSDPFLPVHCVFQIQGIRIASPGEYLFVVTFDKQFVADRRVWVRAN